MRIAVVYGLSRLRKRTALTDSPEYCMEYAGICNVGSKQGFLTPKLLKKRYSYIYIFNGMIISLSARFILRELRSWFCGFNRPFAKKTVETNSDFFD